MRLRTLGRTGLRVSDLFLGTMGFTTTAEATRMIDRYQDAGGNVIDTAPVYGDSEDILGRVLHGTRRDHFVLATKFTLPADPANPLTAGSHRKSLRLSLERSLRRLRTDHIDLLWVHCHDPRTPVEETMRALDDAVRAGTVLYTGASNLPAWAVAAANTGADLRDRTPFSALQVPYSLARRDIERELLPMARTLGLSTAAYSPLGGSLLSGRFAHPDAPATGRVDPADLTEHERALARTLHEAASDEGVGDAPAAIAWLLSRPDPVHPILGPRTDAQLTDLLTAADTTLSPHTLDRLEEASRIPLGYPADLIAQTLPWLDGPREVHPR
ncbi:aldo/keto reductase [Nocardiopsis changdeensis]|uniref:Aldo/keto reductase n=1 Tax=Nocardiopsis changdeensis TaxID=2831969 RepID=A0ABX8BT56_9ACTN|nr:MULTISPECIES: aldo/keto reductase [Nocardiopsis]QUX25425.1 aldo/keto reductase [Nocardiopsis changdeensis]QYX35811.1 aldo/keto reductase [Nocardiopsis sp. MT53]